ncbi:MAG: hypothetical protein WDA09_00325 [Bacteriovoracaceae bacterium]
MGWIKKHLKKMIQHKRYESEVSTASDYISKHHPEYYSYCYWKNIS